MKGTWSLDLIWWITAFELPAMAGLFWMIWRNRQDFDSGLSDLRGSSEQNVGMVRDNLSAYKLEVAKNYASISYIKDVERRLTSHLVRIENKLDKTSRQGEGE